MNFKIKLQIKNKSSFLTTFGMTITVFIFFLQTSFAQQIFINEGQIEFEKKVNLHKELDSYGDSWLDNFKDKIPQFRTDYFNLYFKDNKTLFEKEKDNDQKIPFFGDSKTLDDIVYTDLPHQTFTKKENVYEQTFLLKDSIRKIDWRITNDTRDIAGFECRKVVGKILDSVYVVAFYTDQITVSGGPFSFCNLPGMILGIAIPRLNMTCFATKVELLDPPSSKIIAPSGKRLTPVNYKELEATLKKALSDWSSDRKSIITFML